MLEIIGNSAAIAKVVHVGTCAHIYFSTHDRLDFCSISSSQSVGQTWQQSVYYWKFRKDEVLQSIQFCLCNCAVQCVYYTSTTTFTPSRHIATRMMYSRQLLAVEEIESSRRPLDKDPLPQVHGHSRQPVNPALPHRCSPATRRPARAGI